MSARETTFTSLAGVPVHYDRLKPPSPHVYGSKGQQRTWHCRRKLKTGLQDCFTELFRVWLRETPSIILTAGTIGDRANAHGQGYAFDLDGFYWGDRKFMMLDYPANRRFYLGVNAHLFLYFSQVLSYHYPNHKDHFHVDFNFSHKFRPESNSQTFFVQACLKYLYRKNLGRTGIDRDGVDGIFGGQTEAALNEVLRELALNGRLTTAPGWRKFLLICRDRAFAGS